MCHISPVQPFQLWEVVEEVCGVVAQGTEGVGPMGGVGEGELLKVMEREEGGHILREGGEGEGREMNVAIQLRFKILQNVTLLSRESANVP